MSLFVARNGHERRAGECPLLEEERKSRLRPLTSESDRKRPSPLQRLPL